MTKTHRQAATEHAHATTTPLYTPLTQRKPLPLRQLSLGISLLSVPVPKNAVVPSCPHRSRGWVHVQQFRPTTGEEGRGGGERKNENLKRDNSRFEAFAPVTIFFITISIPLPVFFSSSFFLLATHLACLQFATVGSDKKLIDTHHSSKGRTASRNDHVQGAAKVSPTQQHPCEGPTTDS